MAPAEPPREPAMRIVERLWDAMRMRDVDAAMETVREGVVWVPVIDDGPPVHGRDALRARLERIAGAGVIADTYALSYEELDDSRILVIGALRVRRPDNWLTTVQRWWIYVIEDGLIVRAQACATREEALATPTSGA